MRKDRIKEELERIQKAEYARKTDAQLWAYEQLSRLQRSKLNGEQPETLQKYNSPTNRTCKLTPKMVREIKRKYNPYVYGKQRLAREYGVSTSVIYRILKGLSWKEVRLKS